MEFFDAFEDTGKKNGQKNIEAVTKQLLRGRTETMSVVKKKC